LIPQKPSDKVGDIYSLILVDLNKAINEFGINNPEDGKFIQLRLTRKIIKQSIVTKVYNVTV
jgi:DNA-directed RNA polymerase